MTSAPEASPWSHACLAAALFAVDPNLSGIVVRAGAGPVRDAWFEALLALLPPDPRLRRLPAGIADDRLMGGLDLAATLQAGRPVAQTGLLAEANGGFLVIPMAERLAAATAARIAAVMDTGEAATEREGVASRAPAKFGVVAFDEGEDGDEQPPPSLLDRLAFRLDLRSLSYREAAERPWDRRQVSDACARMPAIRVPDSAVEALVTAAAELGVDSARAPLLALRVAAAACALRGGAEVEDADVIVAARFVLAPRARRLPTSEREAQEPGPEAADDRGPDPAEENEESLEDSAPVDLNDVVLAAAAAAIPPGLLAQIAAGLAPRSRSSRAGKAGDGAVSVLRGRPTAPRRGALREGRLALADTLRAAAPWQGLRQRSAPPGQPVRFQVRPDDFRIVRFRSKPQTTAIFVVDASGSAAVQRLAEVKGAIELLLADCYVRRDSAALIAFRGDAADLILSPTRSLARAKRILSGLPGGGGTPLAAGLDAALTLADGLRRKGQQPLVVLLTDGRANISRAGAPGRALAFEDALAAARRLRVAGIQSLAVDTASTAATGGETPTSRLSEAMNARYLRLPDAHPAELSQVVRAASARV